MNPGRTDGTALQDPGQDWVKVSSKPPTWYPRGVAADCSTDFQNGEWVYTENSQDTRYFIPLHGLNQERRTKLRKEALAARTRDKKNRIVRDDSARFAKNCATTLFLLSPPGWFFAMSKVPGNSDQHGLGGFGGINPSGGIIPSIGSIGGCSGVGSGTGGCGAGAGGR